MKVFVKLLFLVGILSFVGGKEIFAEISLQSQINEVQEGGTLRMKAGVYHGPIVLKKPIILEGEQGTILKNCSSKPAIKITGKQVSVKGIKIVSCKKDESPPAIFMSGNNHRLEELEIDTRKLAIKLEKVRGSTFQNIRITGIGNGNGVDLWESHQNSFNGMSIDHVEDGFYMENSHYNTFTGNTIRDSRYGLHIMFSDYITLVNNVSSRNYTGAMIMGTNHSVIKDNQLLDNNQNVNAQGLLLYDVHESTITGNQISHNRVGLFIEDASENEMKNNEFTANFVGAQINRIEKNVIEGNIFISNVNDFQATDGSKNTIQRNYWDSALKLDTDGDGNSNLPHRADPFFLNLAKETPPYQLFFQHPGLMLLQKMLKSPDHLLVTDEEPLMNNMLTKDVQKESRNGIFWFLSLLMISSSLLIIYFGRKKT